MEKLSLYNLLSILLPGALLTLTMELMLRDSGINIERYKLNQYFTLTVFLSTSIFLGSVINISTRTILNLYEKIGLYTNIFDIYNNSKIITPIKPYFEKIVKKEYAEINKDSIVKFWSIMYYDLEAHDNIKVAKSYQSFYFFFRNFFTLSIILMVMLSISLIFKYQEKYAFLFIGNLFGMVLSIYAGKWYRVKMIEKMFWTYYSLKK